MSEQPHISIAHFSDILCIWAYIAQIRIDELKHQFSASVDLQYHFFPVFGAVDALLEKNWAHKGGISAYNQHVLSVASRFDHIEINPELWRNAYPKTSQSCHLYLKALQLLVDSDDAVVQKDQFEYFVWQVRLAFFKNAENIADNQVLRRIIDHLGLPLAKIEAKINNGEAFAALELDAQLAAQYHVVGSPTLVFNEGRQTIYGNVGYRVIEANIRELLSQPENQSSWC